MFASLQASAVAEDAKPIIVRAAMDADRTIIVELRRTADGTPLNAIFRYRIGAEGYQQQLDHIGGLRPGETRPVPPCSDEMIRR